MATAEHIPGSILSGVVEHERSLLTKLQDARDAARSTVEDARADARDILRAEESKLAEETAAMRRKADEERTRAFEATVQAAEENLAGVRSAAESKVPQVADEVLKLFVPATPGEWNS